MGGIPWDRAPDEPMRRRYDVGAHLHLWRDGRAERGEIFPRHVVADGAVAAIGDAGNGKIWGIDEGERGNDDEQQDQE